MHEERPHKEPVDEKRALDKQDLAVARFFYFCTLQKRMLWDLHGLPFLKTLSSTWSKSQNSGALISSALVIGTP